MWDPHPLALSASPLVSLITRSAGLILHLFHVLQTLEHDERLGIYAYLQRLHLGGTCERYEGDVAPDAWIASGCSEEYHRSVIDSVSFLRSVVPPGAGVNSDFTSASGTLGRACQALSRGQNPKQRLAEHVPFLVQLAAFFCGLQPGCTATKVAAVEALLALHTAYDAVTETTSALAAF